MNALSNYFAVHSRAAWLLILSISVALGSLMAWSDVQMIQRQRLSLLQTEAQRTSLQIMSQTMNGNLMGSVTLLGLIDRDIKQEATMGLLSADAHNDVTFSTLGNAFGAAGVFLVGQDGIVKTAWDRIGKTATGLDVQFRPYFTMAMRGQHSVYAAVSMSRGDRSLYFSAPVYAQTATASTGVGAVVARTDVAALESILKTRFDAAVLLSPQGLVFASSKPEWDGRIDSPPTPARLDEIRRLKQFGATFDANAPTVLPISMHDGVQTLDGTRFVVASAAVKWNDPGGDWRLVLMEDLSRSLSIESLAVRSGAAFVLSFLMGWLWLRAARGRFAQALAHNELKQNVQRQHANVQYRAELAKMSMHLQRCTSVDELAQVFLADARGMLGVVQGAMYVVHDGKPEVLVLAGSSASAIAPPQTLNLGEGLLGECARERRTQLIPTPPEGIWTIRSGLGGAQPEALLLAPLVMQDQLIGVVELATLQPISANVAERLTEVVATLASTLEILQKNLQLQSLARQSADPIEEKT